MVWQVLSRQRIVDHWRSCTWHFRTLHKEGVEGTKGARKASHNSIHSIGSAFWLKPACEGPHVLKASWNLTPKSFVTRDLSRVTKSFVTRDWSRVTSTVTAILAGLLTVHLVHAPCWSAEGLLWESWFVLSSFLLCWASCSGPATSVIMTHKFKEFGLMMRIPVLFLSAGFLVMCGIRVVGNLFQDVLRKELFKRRPPNVATQWDKKKKRRLWISRLAEP